MDGPPQSTAGSLGKNSTILVENDPKISYFWEGGIVNTEFFSHHFADMKNKEVNLDLLKIQHKLEKSHKAMQSLPLIFFKWGHIKILKHILEAELFKPSSLGVSL